MMSTRTMDNHSMTGAQLSASTLPDEVDGSAARGARLLDNAMVRNAMVGRSAACRAAIRAAANGAGRLSVYTLTRDGMRRELAAEVVDFLARGAAAVGRTQAAEPARSQGAGEPRVSVPVAPATAPTRPESAWPPLAEGLQRPWAATPDGSAQTSWAWPMVSARAGTAEATGVAPASAAYRRLAPACRDELEAAKWPAPDLAQEEVETAHRTACEMRAGNIPASLFTREQTRRSWECLLGFGAFGAANVGMLCGVTLAASGPVGAGMALLAGGMATAVGAANYVLTTAAPSDFSSGPLRLGPHTLLGARAVADACQAQEVVESLRTHGVLHPEERGNGYAVVNIGPLREALMAVNLTPYQRSRVEQVVRYVSTTAASRLMASDLTKKLEATREQFHRGIVGAESLRRATEAARVAQTLCDEQMATSLTWTEKRDLP